MKIIFLDIDGVLNSRQYITHMSDLFDDPKHQIDPACVVRLNTITDTVGANIVVSSTWRKAFHSVYQLQECIASYGITGKVVGMTPDFVAQQPSGLYVAYGHRGGEITAWMNDNLGVDNYIVIDDESVMGHGDRLIKTQFDTGLLDSHVEIAITMLGRI
jgi:hypothetical protein